MTDPPVLGIQGQWAESRTGTATFLPKSESNHKFSCYEIIHYAKYSQIMGLHSINIYPISIIFSKTIDLVRNSIYQIIDTSYNHNFIKSLN